MSLCVGVVVVVAALAGSVDAARACSCGPPNPWYALAGSDGAFIGRLVARRDTDRQSVFTFAVERAVKGRFGGSVNVLSGGSCGLHAEIGERIGLFVMRQGDTWVAFLCSTVDPGLLIAATAPLPAPNGRGPPALYVGGRMGPARMIALDAQGQTLAYGRGEGITRQLSVCPGGKRVAELAYDDYYLRPMVWLAVRDARTLRVVRQRTVQLPEDRRLEGLLCERGSGSSVVLFAARPGPKRPAVLYRLANRPPREIWRGGAFLSSLVPGAAYVNFGYPAGKRLVRVDLRTGRAKEIGVVLHRPRLVPDATGRRLAGIAVRDHYRSRIVLVELGTSVSVRWTLLDTRSVDGDVHFLPNGRLLFLPSGFDDTGRVLDRSLRTVGRFQWRSVDSALVGSRVFGVAYTGELLAARVPGGPGQVVRELPHGAVPEVIVSAR